MYNNISIYIYLNLSDSTVHEFTKSLLQDCQQTVHLRMTTKPRLNRQAGHRVTSFRVDDWVHDDAGNNDDDDYDKVSKQTWWRCAAKERRPRLFLERLTCQLRPTSPNNIFPHFGRFHDRKFHLPIPPPIYVKLVDWHHLILAGLFPRGPMVSWLSFHG